MNIGRIFAHAVVRRIAYLVVAMFASLLVQCFAEARADNHPERQEAYEHCMSQAQAYSDLINAPPYNKSSSPYCQPLSAQAPNRYRACVTMEGQQCNGAWFPGGDRDHFWPTGQDCPPPEVWDDVTKQCVECQAGNESPTNPGNIGRYRCRNEQCPLIGMPCNPSGPSPGFVCWVTVGGSKCGPDEPCPSGMTKDPITGDCVPPEECPEGTIKDENGQCVPPAECPEGQIKDQFGICKPQDGTCPPGQVQAPDGTCNDGACPAGMARGKDGTCKKDSDGDGNPDDEDGDGDDEDGQGTGDDESTFSGGADCTVPPTCSGDNIMCGQATIQWRIDCNTRAKANIAGGNCTAPPVCAGDGCKPLDYAILVTQWRTACAVEALAQGVGNVPGDGDGDGDDEATGDVGQIGEDAVEGAAGSSAGGCDTSTGEECGIGNNEVGGDGNGELDDDGLGWSRSCPQLPVVQFMGATIDFNSGGGVMCDWLTLGGQFVLVLAALASLRILTGGMG